MKRLLIIILLLVSAVSFAGDREPVFNRQPLVRKDYAQLPLGSIKAEGWTLDQLQRQRDGLTGHLDSIYAKVVGPRNGWLGGDGDVWERGPYWLDGLLPLAYILDDRKLKEKVQPWIEWTLASQKENGFFGPDTDRPYEAGLQRDNSHDWWPKMVMMKVMQQYYSATGDKRVIDFLTKYFRYQLEELPKTPLGNWTFWGEQRGADNLQVVHWLYDITGDRFLLDLGELIHKQTFNWTRVFTTDDYLTRQLSLHCVNVAQGFKAPVVYYQQSKDAKYLQAMDSGVAMIRNTIGLPTGLWGGDELLRFGSPVTGSEFCTAVEMMFSLESILEITGDAKWGDYLERVAFNALPTQATDGFSARQYFQQFNQIEATRNWREFSTPHTDVDVVFGELNGYPCCTANMHQGWPKFVQNLWYATVDEGVAALVYAPSRVSLSVAGGVEAEIVEETEYPFDEKISFKVSFADKKVKAASFPFHFRIPGWCKDPVVKINGTVVDANAWPGEICVIRREWRRGDVLTVELPAQVSVSRWYDKGAVVERGPLIYALKMDEKWTRKEFGAGEEEYGKWYYEVTSDTPWNYGLSSSSINPKNIAESFKVEKAGVRGYPWNVDNAPVKIVTNALVMKNWKPYNGSTGPIAYSPQQGIDFDGTREIELIPYGCTTLRVAEFPVRNTK